MLSEKQQKNYSFFQEHLEEYLNNPLLRNKYAIFCNEELQGAYDLFEMAYANACARFPIGEFVIQQIIGNSDVVEFLWTAVG